MKYTTMKDKAAVVAAMAKGRKLFTTASEHTQNVCVNVLMLAMNKTLMFDELNDFIKELPGVRGESIVEYFTRFGGFTFTNETGFDGWKGAKYIKDRFNGWTEDDKPQKGPKEVMWWECAKKSPFKIDSLDAVIKAAMLSFNNKAKKAKKLGVPVDSTISDELAKMLLRHSSLASLLAPVEDPLAAIQEAAADEGKYDEALINNDAVKDSVAAQG